MKTTSFFARGHRALARTALLLAGAAVIGGCTTTPWNDTFAPRPAPAPVAAGYYRVNAGDTLASIAAAYGQRPQELASWNRMPVNAPVVPGQVLRVAPPVVASVAPPAAGGAPGQSPTGTAPIHFSWPARGAVVVRFEAGKSKGIVIAGAPGEAVTAAADGRVVYVGTGIPEYGPLIVIKHNDNLVSAYGHAGKLLVNEGDAVRAGQQIGEMATDASGRGTIEFEIRRDGTPVDPLNYLPRAGG
ncbi:LysM peptidoglycan-binding domain-containing protein [Trinickia violacea]|uniref:LysM peptidoglycan-binding domain-containing protein n=1 Tax=Trinickia violacea TaxID=2571746 RepID=A0A4P8IXM2_9BURK|nr:peptidoglycan DD-metalloendopeptidase family protein [Trinickia violacea]QCP54052.1 LysM peptidoglycan-binding domain-containing protein [Trinickia violacea]